QHEYLRPRCRRPYGEADERRFPRQYRRVLVPRARLARAQSTAAGNGQGRAMTLFLASVTDAAEAEIALAHGVDIIDFKHPARGALGALDTDEVRAGVGAIAGRRPVSAVTGDLPMRPEVVVEAVRSMASTGVDFVKVGLFPESGRAACVAALRVLAGKAKLIGVMFADLGPDSELIRAMAEAGFAGAMLVTARKDGPRRLDHIDMPTLRAIDAVCMSYGVMAET